MSYIDDAHFDERARLAGFAAVAVGAFFTPAIVLHALGLAGFAVWLEAVSGLIRWPILLAMWGVSFVALLGIARGVISFTCRLVPAALSLAERIGALIADLLAKLVFGGAALATGMLKLALYPVRCGYEALRDRVQAQCGLYLQNWREEQELRRLYRDEFRDEFRTFREFKRQFREGAAAAGNTGRDTGSTGGEQQQQQKQDEAPAATSDPFAAACRLLGLAEAGNFTAAELKTRYRALMKGVHPDVAGPNGLATQINAANSLIKKRKGWS